MCGSHLAGDKSSSISMKSELRSCGSLARHRRKNLLIWVFRSWSRPVVNVRSSWAKIGIWSSSLRISRKVRPEVASVCCVKGSAPSHSLRMWEELREILERVSLNISHRQSMPKEYTSNFLTPLKVNPLWCHSGPFHGLVRGTLVQSSVVNNEENPKSETLATYRPESPRKINTFLGFTSPWNIAVYPSIGLFYSRDVQRTTYSMSASP